MGTKIRSPQGEPLSFRVKIKVSGLIGVRDVVVVVKVQVCLLDININQCNVLFSQ